jgi:hypothetical protein
LNVEQDQARSGQYTAMIKASASEKRDQLLFVSLLYPMQLSLDLPNVPRQSQQQQQNSFQNDNQKSTFSFSDSLRTVMRYLALPIAIGLTAFIIYGQIKRSRRKWS